MQQDELDGFVIATGVQHTVRDFTERAFAANGIRIRWESSRPFVPSEQSQVHDDRLCVNPGLSCYWQPADTTKMGYEEQLELDYKYIRECGVRTDMKIICKTVMHIFKGGNC